MIKLLDTHRHQKIIFEPEEGQCKAQILLLHGICEHSRRYIDFGKTMSAQGIRVLTFDHLSHGSSVKMTEKHSQILNLYQENLPIKELIEKFKTFQKNNPEDIKEFSQNFIQTMSKTTIFDLVQDILKITQDSFLDGSLNKDIPFFVMGQSMGGLLASEVTWQLQQSKYPPTGFILFSPALRPACTPAGKSLISKIRNVSEQFFLNSSLVISKIPILNTLQIGFLQLFSSIDPKLDVNWAVDYISDIEEETELFRVEPTLSRLASLSFLTSIQNLIFQVHKKINTYQEIPYIFFYGEKDGIVDSRGADTFSRNFPKSEHSQIHKFTFKYHETLRTSQKDNITKKLLTWLETVCNKNKVL